MSDFFRNFKRKDDNIDNNNLKKELKCSSSIVSSMFRVVKFDLEPSY